MLMRTCPASDDDDDDDEEVPIYINNIPKDDKKKLKAASKLSKVFDTELPEDTIHIIVERTSPRPSYDPTLHPEVAALRKQLSDMEQLNAELKSTNISLGIIEKRGGKKIICTYATDIKLATIQQLRTLLHHYFEQFDGDDFVEIFAYQPGSSKPAWLSDDVALRSCLQQAKENDWKNLTISLDSPAKSFSTYTWNEMMEQYGVGGGPEFLPLFDIEPRSMNDGENIMLEEIVKECSRRNEAYIFGPSSSEFTRNTIVDGFMVEAMQFYKADMFLAQQQQMSGRRGHGPVDFAMMDRIHQTQVLGVTEVKKDDHVQGLAQNMVQLDVAVQQKRRKRVDETDDDKEGPPARRLKSYGIVTDAFKWTFVECTLEDDDTLTYKAKEVLRDLRLQQENTLREDAKTLFEYVLSLYDRMKDETVNRSTYGSPAYGSPTSNKRIATGLGQLL
ncbi:hypothetical protein BGX21_005445 [Mortierella sp. AD011]|nr:hypothetical protein BGX20_004356 [Mortierella sp. AD010]KAF9370682.1 hypothetical protein BGX21_005445 [Mortierella sp. AD011]